MLPLKDTAHHPFSPASWGWWPVLSVVLVAVLNYLVQEVLRRRVPHKEEEQLKRLVDIYSGLPGGEEAAPALKARIDALIVQVAAGNLRGEWAYSKDPVYLSRRSAIPAALGGLMLGVIAVVEGLTERWDATVTITGITGLTFAGHLTYLVYTNRTRYRELKAIKELWHKEEAARLAALRPLLDPKDRADRERGEPQLSNQYTIQATPLLHQKGWCLTVEGIGVSQVQSLEQAEDEMRSAIRDLTGLPDDAFSTTLDVHDDSSDLRAEQ